MPRIKVDTEGIEAGGSVAATPITVTPEPTPTPVAASAEPETESLNPPSLPPQNTTGSPSGILGNLKSLLDKDTLSKSGSSLFSSFSVSPSGVTFGEAENGETILLLLRAHVATNIPWMAISLFMLVAPLVLIPLMSGMGGLGVGAGTGLVFVLFWYAGTLTYAFLNFLYWYFNVYIVTNHRIIDTDWYSVVIRKVSSTQIVKIQDVSASQAGALAGMFDYGDVSIQTAGEEENFEFTDVPHPQLVAKQLNELMEKEETESGGHHEP